MRHILDPSPSPLDLFLKLSNWIGIAIYGWIIVEMFQLWHHPGPDDAARILTLATIMAFEFVLVHSGVFMAVMPKKISLLVFIPFYGVFALAMNAMTPGNTILWLYLGIIAVRMRFAFSNPTEEAKGKNMTMSVAAVMTYFVLIFVFAFGANIIPDLGLTAEYLESSGFQTLRNGATGIFIESPQVPLAMGIVYFTLIALWEIKIFGLLKPAP